MQGDTLNVTYRNENGEIVLVTSELNDSHAMTVDEAVLFSATFEGRRALGGMVLEEENSSTRAE
jgi:hypothetical protein